MFSVKRNHVSTELLTMWPLALRLNEKQYKLDAFGSQGTLHQEVDRYRAAKFLHAEDSLFMQHGQTTHIAQIAGYK